METSLNADPHLSRLGQLSLSADCALRKSSRSRSTSRDNAITGDGRDDGGRDEEPLGWLESGNLDRHEVISTQFGFGQMSIESLWLFTGILLENSR